MDSGDGATECNREGPFEYTAVKGRLLRATALRRHSTPEFAMRRLQDARLVHLASRYYRPTAEAFAGGPTAWHANGPISVVSLMMSRIAAAVPKPIDHKAVSTCGVLGAGEGAKWDTRNAFTHGRRKT